MYKRDWVRRAEEDAEKAVVIVMCNVERAIKKRLEKNNMVLLLRAKVGERERERELDWDLGWNAGKNVYTVESYERYGTKQDEEEEEQTKHSF